MKNQVEKAFSDYLLMAYRGQKIEGIQLTELRRAFFAGCWMVYCKSECVNELEAEQLDAIGAECKQFKEDVLAGKK